MKEGAYVFRFGMKQKIRMYYFHQKYRLEIDPNFTPNLIEILRSPLSPSTEIKFKLNNKNFEYCVNYVYGTFDQENRIRDAIKCEMLPSYFLNYTLPHSENSSYGNPKKALQKFPCKWEWKKNLSSFSVFLMSNETSDIDEMFKVDSIETNDIYYVPALTCEMHQFVNQRGGMKKWVKFAIPFYYNMLDVMKPRKVSILSILKGEFTAPWAALLTIPAIGLACFVFYCYRRKSISSHKLG